MEEVYKNELDIMRLRHLKISGRSKGWGARDVCPLVSNSFIFMQFLAKILENNRLAHPHPHLGVGTPLGNPGYTSENFINYIFE